MTTVKSSSSGPDQTGVSLALIPLPLLSPEVAVRSTTKERRLYRVMGNSQKLDGGAMFGNAPKALWERWVSADNRNRIDLACRALLVLEPDRRILFEAGIGAFFDPKLRDRFGVTDANHVLLDNLTALGIQHEDIDVVVLSHLHFDHAGGLLSAYQADEPLRLLFPNAHFVVSEAAFERAIKPHARDKASFIPTLNEQLSQSGRLSTRSNRYCQNEQ